MYRCFNIKKFLKLAVCDIIIIITVASIAFFGKEHWFAVTLSPETDIFLPVIMYHSIIDDPSKSDIYVVTPEMVENDLKYLKENGYTAILASDLVDYIEKDIPLPEKPVMITIDDGYYNNMFYLLPLLEKYDMKAIISVVGSFTDRFSLNDSHNPKYSHLTWDDISELSQSGYIEIANHTYDMHSGNGRRGCAKLYNETDEEYKGALYEDLGKLQTKLKETANITPITFTYPFGSISRESISVLKELGFKMSMTCREQPNYINKDPDCLFGISRYNRASNISTYEFMQRVLKH